MKQFSSYMLIRKSGRTLSIFLSFVFLNLCTFPAVAQVTVVGTADPLQDVKNIQKAVENGGEILLKGHFAFGPTGRVIIRKSVRITGEVDSLGLPVTSISGGFWTFYSPLPVPGAPPGKKGPLISISSLHFTEAKGTPMHFAYASGLEVKNTLVEKVTPQELAVKWSESDTLLFMAGIVAGNRLDHRKNSLDRAVQGVITIRDNRFDMLADKPDMTAGRGIMVDWTWGATIRVENNIVSKASRNGIELLDNRRSDKGEGSIAVRGNKIVTDDRGIEYPNEFTPNGIVTGWYFDTSGGSDFGRNSPTYITANRVEIRGETSTGILCFGNDTIIAGNDIIVSGGRKARGIIQTGSRGLINANRFRGQGQYAVFSVPFEKLTASLNTFAWNEFDEFTGIKGQMLLSGNLNKVLGNVMVNDKGKGNRQKDIPPARLPGQELEDDDWEPVDTLP